MDYGFSVKIVRNKSIKVSGIAYYEWGEVEEEIGAFTFDKVIYRHSLGEYLAIKRPGNSKIWGDYRFRSGIVKLVYLNIYIDSVVWCWVLTEDWSESEVKKLEEDKQGLEDVLGRFRERMRVYDKEFFGGERVESYIRYQLLHFKVIERMGAPDAIIVSTERIERYFKPATLFIDIS